MTDMMIEILRPGLWWNRPVVLRGDISPSFAAVLANAIHKIPSVDVVILTQDPDKESMKKILRIET